MWHIFQVIVCSCTESWDNTDPGMSLGLFSYFLCSITKTKGNKKLLQLDCEDSEKKWSLFTFKSHILLNFFWLLPSMSTYTEIICFLKSWFKWVFFVVVLPEKASIWQTGICNYLTTSPAHVLFFQVHSWKEVHKTDSFDGQWGCTKNLFHLKPLPFLSIKKWHTLGTSNHYILIPLYCFCN